MSIFVTSPQTVTLPVRMYMYATESIDPMMAAVSALMIALTALRDDACSTACTASTGFWSVSTERAAMAAACNAHGRRRDRPSAVRLHPRRPAVPAACTATRVLTAVLTHAARSCATANSAATPRAGFCLMGACQDCWVRLRDGERLRACSTLLEPRHARCARGACERCMKRQTPVRTRDRRRRPGRHARRRAAGRGRPAAGRRRRSRALRRPDLSPAAGERASARAARPRTASKRQGASAVHRPLTRCATADRLPARDAGLERRSGALDTLHAGRSRTTAVRAADRRHRRDRPRAAVAGLDAARRLHARRGAGRAEVAGLRDRPRVVFAGTGPLLYLVA